MDGNKPSKEEHFDCFVVMSEEGKFWDGAGWVKDWHQAEQFTDPPHFDSWLACNELALSLSDRSGLRCTVAFFTERR